MRPFRSRVATALVFAILVLGLLGTVANAAEIPSTPSSFPEDPWPGLSCFPEDPWPGLSN
jgi:hypothetical protein